MEGSEKMKNIANIITQILTYSDTVGTTDNPQLRGFDWNRRLSGISIGNPYHRTITVPAGDEAVLFDGMRSSSLDVTSVLSISNIDQSIYKLQVTSGQSGNWRTARSITPISDVNITVNNNSVATFEFVAATITGVISGDFLRVAGDSTFDTGPFSFDPINSGLWKVIGTSGNKIQAVRPTGESFSGIAESVTSIPAGQISVYSATGVQPEDKMEISGGFSSASFRTFTIKDVTNDTIYFISTSPIPEESAVSYPNPSLNGESIFIYNNSKVVFFLESDQEISVKFNDDSGDKVKVCPIEAGNPDLVGYLHKYGPTYKAVVKNRSVNTATVLYFVAE